MSYPTPPRRGQPQPPWPSVPPPPADPAGRPGAFRYAALACVTLVALGALVLAGLLLFPRAAPTPVLVAPVSADLTPATVAPAPEPASAPTYVTSGGGSGSADGYSCGSADGHAVWIENGTVPCDHARAVASQWTTSGTTPGDGEGPAGTMYSWSCTSDGSGDGYCTSKMGSHLRIGA